MIERARRQWAELAPAFPGDADRGILCEDENERVMFFSRFASLACPVLEEASGRCLLYPFRPLSCRSFGVPILCAKRLLPPCRLNFVGAPAAAVRAGGVDPDPVDRESELINRLHAIEGHGGDTVAAAALAPSGL